MAQSTKVRKGNDLMVFIGGKSVAFATNHTLTFSTETEEIQSKDSGYDGATLKKKVTWEIQTENLFIDKEYDALVAKMQSNSDPYVDVVWGVGKASATGTPTQTTETGITQTWDASTGNYVNDTTQSYFTGKALISSLVLNAQAGENATYSCTLTGSGTFVHTKATA